MRSTTRSITWFSLVIVLCNPESSRAQGVDFIQSHYTKYEYKIPMRDGVKLFTSVYMLKTNELPVPIMLSRTPYSVGPYGVDKFKSDLGPSSLFGNGGFIFAYQDARGRYMSEGEFVNMRPYIPDKSKPSDVDESSDAYDTIDWLVKNIKGNNGKVGVWGISYPGFYTAAAMIDAHPAMAAASPQAPVTDWFVGDDWHHNGAFLLPHAYNFLAGFGRPRPAPTSVEQPRPDPEGPDGYRWFLDLGPLKNVNEKVFKNDVAFWNEIMAHGTYDDFWKARNLRPHLKNIKPAVMTVGGWFDAENLFGALETYKNVERSSPGAKNILVMGPWSHGGWSRSEGSSLSSVNFRSKTAEFYRQEIEFQFFKTFLREEDEQLAPRFPEAWVFETGTDQWRKFDSWPPKNVKARELHLHASGELSFDAPNGEENGFDEYISDPAKPVPYLRFTPFRMAGDYMAADQRHASTRPDVLVYQTPVLKEDLTIAGAIHVKLNVETTGTDGDFIVKLINDYPNDYPEDEPAPNQGPTPSFVPMGGYQQLVRGDVMRAKFRTGFDKPTPLPSGEPVEIEFDMPDCLHSFRSGHRLMVQVQSSWFPLIDRNPQKFVDIYSAKESDFQKATMKIHHSPKRPSFLVLGVMP